MATHLGAGTLEGWEREKERKERHKTDAKGLPWLLGVGWRYAMPEILFPKLLGFSRSFTRKNHTSTLHIQVHSE